MARQERIVNYLVKALEYKTIKPQEIDTHHKKLLAHYLYHEKNWTQQKIADHLEVTRKTIYNYCEAVFDHFSKTFAPFETAKIARWRIGRARERIARARAKDDLWLEEKIESTLLDQLGKMGFIHYKADPVNVIMGDQNQTHISNRYEFIDLPTDPNARAAAVQQAVEDITILQSAIDRRSGGA